MDKDINNNSKHNNLLKEKNVKDVNYGTNNIKWGELKCSFVLFLYKVKVKSKLLFISVDAEKALKNI